jgi:hypothetical protein
MMKTNHQPRMKLNPIVAVESEKWLKTPEGLKYNAGRDRLITRGCTTCCGVTEITNLYYRKDMRGWLATVLRARVKSGRTLLVYYAVDKAVANLLQEYGFVQWASFCNPNTSNQIYCLGFQR